MKNYSHTPIMIYIPSDIQRPRMISVDFQHCNFPGELTLIMINICEKANIHYSHLPGQPPICLFVILALCILHALNTSADMGGVLCLFPGKENFLRGGIILVPGLGIGFLGCWNSGRKRSRAVLGGDFTELTFTRLCAV